MVSKGRSTNRVGLAIFHTVALKFDVDPICLFELGVNLERFLRAVELIAVDLLDHVSVPDTDLGVERIRADREQLETLRLTVLEGGNDSRLHRDVVEI